MNHDVLDVLLIVTKLLGTVFAGTFGILGLVTEYRDKSTNAITKWGRLALIGIIVSTIVAIASQAIETVLSRRAAAAAAAQLAHQLAVSNTTLTEVERSIFPLKDLTLSYQVEIPLQNPLLDSYRQRLTAGIQQMYKTSGVERSALGEVVAGSGSSVNTILLGPNLRPTQGDGIVYTLLEQHVLNVALYRQPFSAQQFFQEGTRHKRPDLSFSIEPRSIDMEYMPPTGRLLLSVRNFKVDPTLWHGNDRIASIPDLPESLLITMVPPPDMGSGPLDNNVQSLFDGLHVVRMNIRAGDRTFDLTSFNYQGMYSAGALPKLDSAPLLH